MNYGNALLYNSYISLSLINRLHWVQNCAAHLVTCTGKTEHTKPFLFWLHVRFILLYKIPFQIFKVLNGTAPVYLSHLIQKYIYTSQIAATFVLFSQCQKATHQCPNRILPEHQLSGCGISYIITLNLRQVKKYFVRFFKSTYFN